MNKIKKVIAIGIASSIFTCNIGSVSFANEVKEYSVHDNFYKQESKNNDETESKYNLYSGYQDIYMSQNGEYAIKMSDNTFVEVEKEVIELDEQEQINAICSDEDIPKEIRDYISEKYENFTIDNEGSRQITLFYPDESLESGIAPLSSDTQYKDYNGHSMKCYRTYVSDWTETFKYKEGSSASSFASTATNIVLYIAGIVTSGTASMVIVGLSGAKTLLDIFNEGASGSVIASGSDYIELKMQYSDYKEWVYAKIGGNWSLGLCAEKVLIGEVKITQNYHTSRGIGEIVEKSLFANKNISSKHYADPWETAYKNTGLPVIEWLSIKVGDRTISF